MEKIPSLKISCKYNRKAKICTPEKKEQAKKYRKRGWTFKRIGEKLGISESRSSAIIVGENKQTLEIRKRISREYYKTHRKHCIKRCYENEMWRRQNIPGYYKTMLKRNRIMYAIKTNKKER